jgi:hypothetical protein
LRLACDGKNSARWITFRIRCQDMDVSRDGGSTDPWPCYAGRSTRYFDTRKRRRFHVLRARCCVRRATRATCVRATCFSCHVPRATCHVPRATCDVRPANGRGSEESAGCPSDAPVRPRSDTRLDPTLLFPRVAEGLRDNTEPKLHSSPVWACRRFAGPSSFF